MSNVVIYDALNLDDLDVLSRSLKEKNASLSCIKDHYLPNASFITKANSYYEHWVKLLTLADGMAEPAAIFGSYVTEFVAIAPSLGKPSRLSEEEFFLLEELSEEIGAKRVLITPSDASEKEVIAQIASSYSKRFTNFSAMESVKIYNSMRSLVDRGYEVLTVKSIVGGEVDKTVKKPQDDLMSLPDPKAPLVSSDLSADVFSRLEMANAINDVLSKRIIKKQGGAYDEIERHSREYLKAKLEGLFNPEASGGLSAEDVSMVKAFVKQLKNKMESKK